MRLAVWMRESLSDKLIVHAYAAQVDDLIKLQGVFALQVFDDLVNPATQVRLSELPNGWVPTVDQITVKFGEAGHTVETLQLNGHHHIYGDLSGAQSSESRSRELVRRRVPYKLKEGVAKVYQDSHPLAQRATELDALRKSLTGSIAKARATIKASLSNFTTVGALVKGWPEVEPFTRAWVASEPRLPSVPRQELNTLLDLPVT